MTDPTLTPEVYGDFDLHLANVLAQQAPLVIEVGDVMITRNGGNYRCIHVEDGFAWAFLVTGFPLSVMACVAFPWTIDGKWRDGDTDLDVVAIKTAVVA